MKQLNNNQKGFSLFELIIYITLFTGIIITVISFTLSIINIQNKEASVRTVTYSLNTALNEISTLIRTSNQINTVDCIFDTNPGIISLEMETSSINPTVIDIDPSTNQLRINQGISAAYYLTPPHIQIDDFTITDMSTSKQKILRIHLDISSNAKSDKSFAYDQSSYITVKVRP